MLGIARKIVPPRLRPALDPIRRAPSRVLRHIVPSLREQYRLDRMIGPVGYWKEMQEYQLTLLKKMGLEPHHTLLDIGCGPLSGGLAFIPYLETGNYFGVDLRESAIDEAYKQIAKAGLTGKKPVLVVSSTFGALELDEVRFDFVWASQTTYHLDQQKIEYCLEHVAARLNPGGKFYADFISSPEVAAPGKKWFEYSFHFHSLDYIRELSEKCGLVMSNLGKIVDHGYPVDWGFKNNYLLEFAAPPAEPTLHHD